MKLTDNQKRVLRVFARHGVSGIENIRKTAGVSQWYPALKGLIAQKLVAPCLSGYAVTNEGGRMLAQLQWEESDEGINAIQSAPRKGDRIILLRDLDLTTTGGPMILAGNEGTVKIVRRTGELWVNLDKYGHMHLYPDDVARVPQGVPTTITIPEVENIEKTREAMRGVMDERAWTDNGIYHEPKSCHPPTCGGCTSDESKHGKPIPH